MMGTYVLTYVYTHVRTYVRAYVNRCVAGESANQRCHAAQGQLFDCTRLEAPRLCLRAMSGAGKWEVCMCLRAMSGDDGGVACLAGDFVLAHQAWNAECVYVRNQRTRVEGWLRVTDASIRPVTCRGDVVNKTVAVATAEAVLGDDSSRGSLGDVAGAGTKAAGTKAAARCCTIYSSARAAAASASIGGGASSNSPRATRRQTPYSCWPGGAATGRAVRPPADAIAPHRQSCICGSSAIVHYGDPASSEYKWCLQAQGWIKLKKFWRCPKCHYRPQDTLASDLGERCACHRDVIFAFPAELTEYHAYIRDHLDYHASALIRFGCSYVWHHESCGGSYPPTSPTTWDLSHTGCRVYSKLDFWRPSDDWTNRRWAEVAQHMRESRALAGLDEGMTRGSTLASWMECLVGIVYAIVTECKHMPDGNEIVVEMSRQARSQPQEFAGSVRGVWNGLCYIGVPMPACDSYRVEDALV